MKTPPIYLKKFFWDTDITRIDIQKNRNYVIARLLHLGDEVALKWLKQTYSVSQIQHCLKTSRQLSAKDKNFYHLVY